MLTGALPPAQTLPNSICFILHFAHVTNWRLQADSEYVMDKALLMHDSAFCVVFAQENSPYVLDSALQLYDLDHSLLLWEKQLDTKVVLGWNADTIVIAFRGTKSLTNLWSDVQVLMTRVVNDVKDTTDLKTARDHLEAARCAFWQSW